MKGILTHDGDMFKPITENYSYCQPMTVDHLYCKDLYEPITNQNKPVGKINNDWKLLNCKEIAIIH